MYFKNKTKKTHILPHTPKKTQQFWKNEFLHQGHQVWPMPLFKFQWIALPASRKRGLLFHLPHSAIADSATISIIFYWIIGYSKWEFFQELCVVFASISPCNEVTDTVVPPQSKFIYNITQYTASCIQQCHRDHLVSLHFHTTYS